MRKEKIAVLEELNKKNTIKPPNTQLSMIGSKVRRALSFLSRTFLKEPKKGCNAAIEASYMVSRAIAKAGKSFTEGQFLKDCS